MPAGSTIASLVLINAIASANFTIPRIPATGEPFRHDALLRLGSRLGSPTLWSPVPDEEALYR
jgi:hypothetical protein